MAYSRKCIKTQLARDARGNRVFASAATLAAIIRDGIMEPVTDTVVHFRHWRFRNGKIARHVELGAHAPVNREVFWKISDATYSQFKRHILNALGESLHG